MEISKKVLSYTAAGNLPVKMLTDITLLKSIKENKRIIPIHAQIMPTNKCNLNCSFCSCSKRKKNQEMKLNKIEDICESLSALQCKAVTITGGGEPLMHPDINEILHTFYRKNISIGLVTNGFLLDKLDSLGCVSWMRISLGEDRNLTTLFPIIERALNRNKNSTKFAFSYVVSENPNKVLIAKAITFANEHNFTHVRLVPDLFDVKTIASKMKEIADFLKECNIDDSKVIYQKRDEFTKGAQNCWISMLKPVFDPDGYVYPCCGVQYALKKPGRKMEKSMRICKADDFTKYLNSNKPFCGKRCVKCYYNSYNEYLDILMNGLDDEVFV